MKQAWLTIDDVHLSQLNARLPPRFYSSWLSWQKFGAFFVKRVYIVISWNCRGTQVLALHLWCFFSIRKPASKSWLFPCLRETLRASTCRFYFPAGGACSGVSWVVVVSGLGSSRYNTFHLEFLHDLYEFLCDRSHNKPFTWLASKAVSRLELWKSVCVCQQFNLKYTCQWKTDTRIIFLYLLTRKMWLSSALIEKSLKSQPLNWNRMCVCVFLPQPNVFVHTYMGRHIQHTVTLVCVCVVCMCVHTEHTCASCICMSFSCAYRLKCKDTGKVCLSVNWE